ncbi:MAG: hypothetical protein LQ342_007143 [Letrouitia transgressa]|nr:MAG: hypothetical protein LQ342_007143 [Letrouitia transgressa]
MSSILFGGASLGEGAFSTDGSMTAIYDALDAAKISRIDTARRYPKSSPGCSEQLLGSTGAIKRGFAIDTKINVMSVGQSGGSLSKKKIEESVAASLVALRDDQINVLYCHAPDPETPLGETAAELHRLLTQGVIKEVHLQPMFKRAIQRCLPEYGEQSAAAAEATWYKLCSIFVSTFSHFSHPLEQQLSRSSKNTYSPSLLLSPLAGGFLTGKLSLGQDLVGSRYADGNPMGASYRPMYDKQAMHTAVKELYSGLQTHGIELAEASLRWVYYHSALQEGDGIILGASDIAQIEENMRWISRGRLEKNVVTMFEEIWEKVKDIAP